VAIVSGRRLDDVRNLVGLDGLIYAGNHGLEIQGPGMSFLEPEALETQSAFGWLAAALRRGLTHVAGVIVEDKALTVSVHFRQVAPAHIAEVARHVHAAAAVAPDCFDICLGSQVFEVRPRVDWQKGSAMRWIAAQLARQGRPVALSLFVGDDRTDEDAFDVLGDGITIKVGDPGETCARYHLDSPREVREFLGWLARVSQGTCQVSKNTADDPPTAPL
jgi:trehalose-phosphatase